MNPSLPHAQSQAVHSVLDSLYELSPVTEHTTITEGEPVIVDNASATGVRKAGRPVGGSLDRSDPIFFESEQMQLTRESREQHADVLAETESLPDSFHGASRPNLFRKQEQAHHRLFVYLKAQGLSNKEIAERTGYSVVTVADNLRQPWARELLSEEMRIAGRDALQGLLAGHYEDAVYTLVEVMDDKKEKGSTRVQAANSILNRGLGNPTQPLSLSQTDDLKSMQDDELIAQLQALVKNGGGPN